MRTAGSTVAAFALTVASFLTSAASADPLPAETEAGAGMSSRVDRDEVADDFWTPLYLSTIAGLSTCLGAAFVFCHPKPSASRIGGEDGGGVNKGGVGVSPATMSFSLALAGSVMVTVSVISLGPECLRDPRSEGTAETDGLGGEAPFAMMPLWSMLFLQRLVWFTLGCALYGLLSKCALPEPEEIVEKSLLASGGRSKDDDGDNDGDDGRVEGNNGSFYDYPDHGKYDDYDNGDNDNKRNNLELISVDGVGPCVDEERGVVRGSSSRSSTPVSGRNTTTVRSRSPSALRQSASSSSLGDKGHVDGDGHPSRGDDATEYDEKEKFIPRKGTTSAAATAFRQRRASSVMSNASSDIRSFASGKDLDTPDRRRAWRVALLLFVSLLFHNFPEGLAVAASALESKHLGFTVTIGIAMHNIPEGIAIAVPCLAARPDKPWLAFVLASVSGLAEPAGAWVSLFFLRGLKDDGAGESSSGMGDVVADLGAVSPSQHGTALQEESWWSLENILAFVAGIMITVSLLELFPEARRHTGSSGGKDGAAGGRTSWFEGRRPFVVGVVVGAVVMVATEWYLP